MTNSSIQNRIDRQDEVGLRILRLLEKNPQMTQRQLAASLGVSLGKANFCVQALLQKGLIKLNNFNGSSRKLSYAYLLTPAGVAEKGVITARFLRRKMEEYEQLKSEIALLQGELDSVETTAHVCPGFHTG